MQLCLYQLAEQIYEEEEPQLRSFRTVIVQNHLLVGPPNLEQDHPLEEVGWLLLAVFLYHHGIASRIFKEVQAFPDVKSLPTETFLLFKAVQRCKWQLFQERQKLGQSHKEVCSPVLDKCR